MTDATGTTQYNHYPNSERLQSITYPDGTQMQYDYDVQSLESRYIVDDSRVAYGYDVRNRLNDIVIQRHHHWEGDNWFVYDAGRIQHSYNPDSTLALTSYNEGLFDKSYTYDGFNLASISYKQSDQSIIGSFQYGYDNNRNMTSRTEDGQTASFSYDALQRIKTSSLFNESYQYDERGNRKTLSSDLAPTVPLASYVYDDRDRLIQVTSADGQVVQYRYNGDGLLWERTENSVKTRYYYDENGNLFREGIVQADGSVQLTARYIYGGQGFGPAARDDLASGVVLYYVNNGHGDVTGIVDGVGNIVNEYRYDIWGNPLSVSELVNTPFRYSGEYWDDSTGLQYLRARWYDPSVGRFINEDTYEGELSNPLSQNLYTYVHNNPLIYVDPTGNWCESADGYWSHPGACNDGVDGKKRYSGPGYSPDAEHDGDLILNGPSFMGPPARYDYFASQEYRDDLVRELYINSGGHPVEFLIAFHYSRNILNYAPTTEQEAIEQGWEKLKPSGSVYHQLGIGNKGISKYVSPDGKMEAVYYSDGKIVRDIRNVGTYNFAPPSNFSGHFLYDMLPYFMLGNGPDDPTTGWEMFWASLKSASLNLQGK